ncbi:MAG: DUF883 domain-containing protein [Verrucomicrobiota bacterium]|nr:DUF883 domain-containing protein [Verrucomicrobiota bacterium]
MNTTTSESQMKDTLQRSAGQIRSLASQIEETVQQSKARLQELQGVVKDKTVEVAETADQYVHEKPWQAVGIAAGVGLVIGLIMGRR